MPNLNIRPLAARDSLAALTALLHRAYAPLLARGMNLSAATQDELTTRRRAAEGRCFVAEVNGQLVGTVTVTGPYDEASARWSADVPWFRQRDTAQFHQFAVDPEWQRQHVGSRLVAACEAWARESGFRFMALDVAEPAAELRTLYRRLGYEEVGQVQWPGKAFKSVVMRKPMHNSELRQHLQLLARYNVWATRRLLKAVDLLPEVDYRRDMGLFFKSVHGTLNHLLVGEHELWFKRFAAGESPQLELDSEIETDRQRLKQRLDEGAMGWLPLLDVWPQERLQGQLSYTRTTGQAMKLPFAPTLMHVFNHGTHHRGQVTAALAMLGQSTPELDLVAMIQEETVR